MSYGPTIKVWTIIKCFWNALLSSSIARCIISYIFQYSAVYSTLNSSMQYRDYERRGTLYKFNFWKWLSAKKCTNQLLKCTNQLSKCCQAIIINMQKNTYISLCRVVVTFSFFTKLNTFFHYILYFWIEITFGFQLRQL